MATGQVSGLLLDPSSASSLPPLQSLGAAPTTPLHRPRRRPSAHEAGFTFANDGPGTVDLKTSPEAQRQWQAEPAASPAFAIGSGPPSRPAAVATAASRPPAAVSSSSSISSNAAVAGSAVRNVSPGFEDADLFSDDAVGVFVSGGGGSDAASQWRVHRLTRALRGRGFEVLTAEDERSVGQVLRNSCAVVLCLTAEDVAALAEPAGATAAARTFAVC